MINHLGAAAVGGLALTGVSLLMLAGANRLSSRRPALGCVASLLPFGLACLGLVVMTAGAVRFLASGLSTAAG